VMTSCVRGNEPSVALIYGEFIDQLSVYQLLKKESAVWTSDSSRLTDRMCSLM
jgi:hypothetical protein